MTRNIVQPHLYADSIVYANMRWLDTGKVSLWIIFFAFSYSNSNLLERQNGPILDRTAILPGIRGHSLSHWASRESQLLKYVPKYFIDRTCSICIPYITISKWSWPWDGLPFDMTKTLFALIAFLTCVKALSHQESPTVWFMGSEITQMNRLLHHLLIYHSSNLWRTVDDHQHNSNDGHDLIAGGARVSTDNRLQCNRTYIISHQQKTYFLYIRFGMGRAIKFSDIALGGATHVVL